MTQQVSGYPPPRAGGAPDAPPTREVARDEAQDVGRTAADAGRQVAGTAAEQAGNVAQEVRSQARDLVGEARGQVQDQARSGQNKAADGIRVLGQELREMADNGRSGTASEVARQAADRAERAAAWLSEREPGDVVEEIRSFARRRPGAFLIGAALAGVVVGRLTRGAVDSARAGSPSGPAPGAGYSPVTPPSSFGGTAAAGVSYDAPTPPQGYPASPPYAPTGPGAGAPSVSPLPPAPAGPAYDADPLATPAYDADPLRAYDPEPHATTGRPAYDADPFSAPTPPAEPVGRDSPGTVGEYADELDRTAADRRHSASDERLDDPYRPGSDLR